MANNGEMVKYITNFTLEYPVNDYDEAKNYLEDDDMTQYLPDDLKKAIIKIDWNLVDEQSGNITVLSKQELSEEELDRVSDYIRGQNSDGLGEGFEQQSFANYNVNDDYAEEEYEDDWVMASFDWRTNEYKLQKMDMPVTKEEVIRFLRVRDSGVTNMFDANAVCSYARITKPVHLYIICNFEKCLKYYNIED